VCSARCEYLLTELWKFLSSSFPQSSVVVTRGADIYDDFTRLAMAKITVCSVSTFCFWPALVSVNQVFFPITRLIAKATAPQYTPSFHWMSQFPVECVFPGVEALYVSGPTLLSKLTHPNCKRPTIPEYVLNKKPAVGGIGGAYRPANMRQK
jgi:hypothetical protein